MSINNELLLSVDLKSWQITSTSHGTLLDRTVNDEVKKLYEKVMKEHDYTCYYCGFRSEQWQEIHHINHDHNDNNETNLMVVCPLCHQSHHLNSAYINSGAELIWLPELTQQELNHICRVLFVANQIKEDSGRRNKHYIIENGLPYIWHTLFYSRKKVLENKFGEGCSDLGKFAQVLLDIKSENEKKYENRQNWIKNFKLLHNPRRFHVQTQHWKNVEFKNLEIHNWIKLAKNLEINIPEKELKEINDAPPLDIDIKSFDFSK